MDPSLVVAPPEVALEEGVTVLETTLESDEEEDFEPRPFGPPLPTVVDKMKSYMKSQVDPAMEFLGYHFVSPPLLVLALTTPDYFQRYLERSGMVFSESTAEHWVFRYAGLEEVGRTALRCAVTVGYLKDPEKSTRVMDME